MRIPRLLREVLAGESRRGGIESSRVVEMLGAEEGLITWATLIAVVCFCALIAVVFNVGRIANDKLEAQNAADSTAYSASLVQARAMNAVTSANHMMGELTALYTMHHAIGGQVLDDGDEKGNYIVRILNLLIWIGYGAADVAWATSLPWGAGNFPEYFSPCDDVPKGEATVYDAKCILKEKIIEQYAKHVAASAKIVEGDALLLTIIFAAKGAQMIADGVREQAAANQEIREIKREYRFINSLESFARTTKDIKRNVIPRILDALWSYERLIAGDLIPTVGANFKCAEAARQIADHNMCEGEVLGRPSAKNIGLARAGIPSATLPLVKDPTQNVERTQLMRATYPWIQEWRFPVLVGFDVAARRSRAARFYEYHSDRYAKEICHTFRHERGYKLFVLEDVDATSRSTDKGTESWRKRNGSSKADQMFCVVGVARLREGPAMSHMAFLPVTNPTPITALSQAMIYNANRPKEWTAKNFFDEYLASRLGREAQPVSGWDTLNWTEGATEWKEGKSYFGWLPLDWHWILGRVDLFDVAWPPDLKLPFDGGGVPEPKIQLNWQSKLVPIAPRNLALRVLLVQDQQIQTRLKNQVLPAVLAQKLGSDVINH
ncbi:MAG: Tad domain-containing protein [Pirellulaceae bacterium]